ncbi:MAG TPA: hypothetical protein VNX88_13730 [Terriglobales bacterium]|nr:hypothetical protein [Terriglobales bacterium]
MLSINRPPSLGKFVSVCLGLIAAEAASYIAGKRDIRSLSPQACYATLSFSIARAAALGIPVEIASNLPARWSHARTLTGSIATPIPLVHFHNVWGVVAALAIGYEPATGNLFNASARFPKWSPPNPFIVNCCAELLSGNGLSESSWLNLVHIAPELTTLRSALSGPREGRVALLERALVELRDKAPEARPEVRSMAASFLLAYLASAINPGSLDHIQLLIPLLPSFPDIILWYGLLAGVQNRVGNISGMNGLGRKVIRELMREDDVLSLPACDVALTELEVLSPSARQSPGFNLVSQSGITVEIMPCVNAAFRFDRHDEPISVASDELITLWKNLDDEIDRFERNLDRLRRSSLNRFIDESKSDRRTRRIKT